MKRHIAGVVLALAALGGCAPADEAAETPVTEERSTAEDVEAINALTHREIQAFAAGDLAAAQDMFTDDCEILAPESEPVSCGADFATWFTGLQEGFEIAGEYHDLDTQVSGDWAIQRFTATLGMTPRSGGDGVSENVNGLHIFRRGADGSWRIVFDIWTPNAPNGM